MSGDFIEPFPLVVARVDAGISMEKSSLLGTGNCLAALAAAVVVADRGESPVDEGDIVSLRGLVGQSKERNAASKANKSDSSEPRTVRKTGYGRRGQARCWQQPQGCRGVAVSSVCLSGLTDGQTERERAGC